jgi:hypothetical protein
MHGAHPPARAVVRLHRGRASGRLWALYTTSRSANCGDYLNMYLSYAFGSSLGHYLEETDLVGIEDLGIHGEPPGEVDAPPAHAHNGGPASLW